jgi:hypothetical protein
VCVYICVRAKATFPTEYQYIIFATFRLNAIDHEAYVLLYLRCAIFLFLYCFNSSNGVIYLCFRDNILHEKLLLSLPVASLNLGKFERAIKQRVTCNECLQAEGKYFQHLFF